MGQDIRWRASNPVTIVSPTGQTPVASSTGTVTVSLSAPGQTTLTAYYMTNIENLYGSTKVLAYDPAEKIPFEKSSVEIRSRLEKQLRRESRERYCARLRKGAIVRYFIPGASVGENKNDSDKKIQTSNHNGSSR